MTKPGDKVHVEFDVDSVDRWGYATLSRGGSSTNIHIIDGQSKSIIKSWTPIREPQVGDVYRRVGSAVTVTVMALDDGLAWLKCSNVNQRITVNVSNLNNTESFRLYSDD